MIYLEDLVAFSLTHCERTTIQSLILAIKFAVIYVFCSLLLAVELNNG